MATENEPKVEKIELSKTMFETNINGAYGAVVNSKTLSIYLYETALMPPESQTITTTSANGLASFHIDVDKEVRIRNVVKGKINIPVEDVERIAKWMLEKVNQQVAGSSDGK